MKGSEPKRKSQGESKPKTTGKLEEKQKSGRAWEHVGTIEGGKKNVEKKVVCKMGKHSWGEEIPKIVGGKEYGRSRRVEVYVRPAKLPRKKVLKGG